MAEFVAFLVRIFSRIQTENGDLNFCIKGECGKIRTRKHRIWVLFMHCSLSMTDQESVGKSPKSLCFRKVYWTESSRKIDDYPAFLLNTGWTKGKLIIFDAQRIGKIFIWTKLSLNWVLYLGCFDLKIAINYCWCKLIDVKQEGGLHLQNCGKANSEIIRYIIRIVFSGSRTVKMKLRRTVRTIKSKCHAFNTSIVKLFATLFQLCFPAYSSL